MQVFRLVITCVLFLLMNHAGAKELIIQVALLPPYVMQGEQRGIACDIIERALANQGFKVKFSFTNYKRMEVEVPQGLADGAFAGIPIDNTQVYFSEPVIEFKNVAVTLHDENFAIDRLADLADKHVISFRHANRILGKDFADAIKRAASYFEVADQGSQLRMLNAHRGNVTVLDHRAFIYYAQLLHGKDFSQNRYKQYAILSQLSVKWLSIKWKLAICLIVA